MESRRSALIIGVKTFGEGLDEIPSALNDARAMKKVLEEKGGFEVTKEENCNRDEMEKVINNFFNNSQRSDTLFVYISSHGLTDQKGRFHIATSNTSYDKDTKTIFGAFDARALHDKIKDCPSNSQVWLLDLCHSGAFVRGYSKGDNDSAENLLIQQLLNQEHSGAAISKGVNSDVSVEIKQKEGLVIIASSAMDQKSYLMKDNSNLSICTYYAKLALEGEAATKEGIITVDSFYDFLKINIPEYVSQNIPESICGMVPEIHILQGQAHNIVLGTTKLDPKFQFRRTVKRHINESKGDLSKHKSEIERQKNKLGIPQEEAEKILKELQDIYLYKNRNTQKYKQKLSDRLKSYSLNTNNKSSQLTSDDRRKLKDEQRKLNLENEDILAIYYDYLNNLSNEVRIVEIIVIGWEVIQIDYSIDNYLQVGNIFKTYGLYKEAEKVYKKSIEIFNPNIEEVKKAQIYSALGQVLNQEEKFEEAENNIRKAIRLNTKLAEAYSNMGEAQENLYQIEEAVNHYKLAIRFNPTLGDAHIGLARILKQQGKLDEYKAELEKAIESYNEQIQHNSYNVDAYLGLARTYIIQEKYQQAILQCKKVIKINPDCAQAHWWLGVAFNEQGNYKEAIASCEKSISLNPNLAKCYIDLASSFYSQQNLEEAELQLRTRALNLAPNNAKAHNLLGCLYSNQNRLEDAASEFQESINLDSREAQFYTNLAHTLSCQEKPDEAIKKCQEGLKVNPNHAPTHSLLGDILWGQEQKEEAINCYKKAIEISPDNDSYHNSLGNLFYNQNQLEEAEEEYKIAIGLKPEIEVYHTNLAYLFKKQNKLNEAIIEYQNALNISPENPDIYNYLAIVWENKNEFDNALNNYNKAIELATQATDFDQESLTIFSCNL